MALKVTANTEYLSRTANLLDYNAPYTVEFWFNLTALTAAIQESFQAYATNNNDSDGVRLNTSNQWVVRTAIGGTNLTTTGPTAVAGAWTHYALVRESTSVLKFYLNGVLTVTHTAQDIAGRTAPGNFRLGRGNTASQFMAGLYAHFKAYPFALNEAQVRADMYVLEPLFSPIHAYSPIWPVARAKDFSANGYDWTENGTPTDVDGPALSRRRAPLIFWLPPPPGGAAYTLTAAQGSFALTGQSANLLYGHKLTAAQASFTLSGQAANLKRGYPLVAAHGAFALTGQDAGLRITRLLSAAQASFVLTGQVAGLYRGYLLAAAHGTFTLAGQIAALLFGRKLIVDQASYTLTGQTANLLRGYLLAAAHGAFALSGQDANLVYTPTGGYLLTAEMGAYALSGQDAGLRAARLLGADQAGYVLAGQAAGLLRGYPLIASQASFTVAGQSGGLFVARLLVAMAGNYTLTGQSATLVYSAATPPAVAADRILSVLAENRTYAIVFEDRTLAITGG